MSEPVLPTTAAATAGAEAPVALRPSAVSGNLWRRTAAGSIIALGCIYIAFIALIGIPASNGAQRDFIEYWAASVLLLHHANPYDTQAMFSLEHAMGMSGTDTRISLSPPVALELEAPLGLVGPRLSLALWLLAQLGCLGIAMWLLWRLHGRPDSRLHLLSFLFGPTIACQLAGQIGIFLLLALVLFLCLHRSHPFIAGAALMPLALKPHLFLALGIVLLLWSLYTRTFRILAGFALCLAASCASSLYFDPHAWSHYASLMAHNTTIDAQLPTLSSALRFRIRPDARWIQFVPEAAACCWAVGYFHARRACWDWGRHGLLILLVGELCTPYGFFPDESILLPAVLAGMYQAVRTQRSLLPIFAIGVLALVETIFSTPINGPCYLWTAPAWLAWYLYATWEKKPDVRFSAAQ